MKDRVSITKAYLLDVGNFPRGPAMSKVLSGAHCKCEEERRSQFAILGEFSESQTHMLEIQRRTSSGLDVEARGACVKGRGLN